MSVLANSWDADKYVKGVDTLGEARDAKRQAQVRQDASSGLQAFDPKKITQTCRSPFFHAYCHMVLLVESVPERLAIECEGCICHQHLVQNLSKYKRTLLFSGHYGDNILPCPMNGKLAPELVTGRLVRTFEQVWGMQEQELHVAETWGRGSLTPADRQVFMTALKGVRSKCTAAF